MKKIIATLVMFGTLAASAIAAPSSITLDQSDPSFGDSVTFTLNTNLERPWVSVRCTRDGVLLLDDWRGYFNGYALDKATPLGPTGNWTGGGAECVARLVSLDHKTRVLASTSFSVAP